ncbi:DUF636 domain-containing protein [Coprinopsis cinerea okayama7|uniref:DUF636 domain-containing protein n=1 Tax=Coprinopsis cinerea (strain Okayama-7 / 130 / ATCC MYA-4618 / FGSC 9003) TaxID=240176 RepID=A8NZ40_COPC7|nr:DUF636 domain-containing protein [Coprinopsis cinerea okayama7\|eukprot:XP_001837597.2 DUF636 domain-containing protein [Coprinopsis cinerea okayama7\
MGYMDVRVDGEPLSLDSTESNPIPADLSNLTAYKSSSYAIRYFCSTCSAHMFFRTNETSGDPHWAVLPGVLEKVDGIVSIDHHIFLGDTLDGGLADHYQRTGDKRISRHKTWDKDPANAGVGELPVGWRDPSAKTTSNASPETLPYYCHCKSVQFHLTRATKPSDDPRVYWLVPGEEPTDPIRFITAHCLCNSCRLTGGGLIQSWTMVPPENVIDPTTNAPVQLADPAKRLRGLKQYNSSPGKHREFCGTCGATVFWWKDKDESDDSPVPMDVSVGLVDQAAAGGARAESWLAWYDQLIHKEFALSQETVKALEQGLADTLKEPRDDDDA